MRHWRPKQHLVDGSIPSCASLSGPLLAVVISALRGDDLQDCIFVAESSIWGINFWRLCVCMLIKMIFFQIVMVYVLFSICFSYSFLFPIVSPSLLARTDYLQPWIPSTAPFSLALHTETPRTWPSQVRPSHHTLTLNSANQFSKTDSDKILFSLFLACSWCIFLMMEDICKEISP